jgi:response regulator of citrate/malate metabolism
MSSTRALQSGSVERANDAKQSRDVLTLLDAEYTQRILQAIRTEAKPARAIAEECGASRPTVYRRLNGLRDAGLVEAAMRYDVDGHHRTVFETTFEALSVDVTADGLDVTITTNGSGPSAT